VHYRGGPPVGASAALARAMAETLAHRGPDDAGVWESEDGAVALAQRRLAIIDLSPLGHNPMPWDGGRVWITFNGEIYNFRELRKELEAEGFHFRSQTDTEVLLAAYDRWGLDCLARIVGMFAFALWDTPRRRLWLVRDRLGKKPLYYADNGTTLRFASELKAILADGTFRRGVDREAVGMYLQYGYVPSPHSIYVEARKLPPAHHLVLENGRIQIARYWDPLPFALHRRRLDEREAAAELNDRLATAVAQRMIADVPLGAFLSGGIDSSLVVALMQEQSAAPVQTFTIRFDNAAFNEADHAAAVAQHLGTEHHEETCTGEQMLTIVDRLAGMFDEPFADSSAVPTYLVSRAARRRVTVALSGDGGDELFWGYPRYRFHARVSPILALPRPLRLAAAAGADMLRSRRMRRAAHVLRSDDSDQYARFVSWWRPSEIAQMTGRLPLTAALYGDAFKRGAGLSEYDRPPLLDLVSYLPEDILTKVDRASMAVSLEVRAPLLDHRIAELALALPPHLKQRGATTKYLLRRLLYKRVPRELLERPKMGFGVPLDDWFRGPLRQRMAEFVAGPDLEDLGRISDREDPSQRTALADVRPDLLGEERTAHRRRVRRPRINTIL